MSTTTAASALTVRGLRKQLGEFALDVDLDLPTGYVMGLVGPNGAGKTTTIKCLLDMLRPDSGTVEVLGRDPRTAAQEVRGQLGVVLDHTYVVDQWRVAEVGRVLSAFYPSWDHDRYATLLAEFGLAPRLRVKDLSRGMSMKLTLALALCHDARLLILDEPTSGLDPLARDDLLCLLHEFLEDETRSVLFSTHLTSDLEKIADYVTVLRTGRVVFSGPLDDLLERYALVRGAPADLTEELAQHLIGTRTHGHGFEGLLAVEDAGALGSQVVADAASLDDIVVHIGRDGR